VTTAPALRDRRKPRRPSGSAFLVDQFGQGALPDAVSEALETRLAAVLDG
jgi:hypothetical protein